MSVFDCVVSYKLIAVFVFYLFLPLSAITYYFFRRHRQERETERVLSTLNIDSEYADLYKEKGLAGNFTVAVFYASVVSIAGLAVLMIEREFPSVELNKANFPQKGSRLVFAMAFFGAYVWGLQRILRRYLANDLSPGVYYSLTLRTMVASVVALVVYNAYDALAGNEGSGSGVTANIWPSLAFAIGIFPNRAMRWLMERIPFLSSPSDPSLRNLPLEMIEGTSIDDRMRLAELGIDTCYDLASADFVPLMLNTPYGSRQLIDWILQAKLCVFFGDAVKDLRLQAVRNTTDLLDLTDADIETLAAETSLTKSALVRARNLVQRDKDIERLLEVGRKLSRFWKDGSTAESTQGVDESPKAATSRSRTKSRK